MAAAPAIDIQLLPEPALRAWYGHLYLFRERIVVCLLTAVLNSAVLKSKQRGQSHEHQVLHKSLNSLHRMAPTYRVVCLEILQLHLGVCWKGGGLCPQSWVSLQAQL